MRRTFSVLLFIVGFVHAQYSRPGSTGAQFLKIGVSPRGTAMANAYSAVVEGAEAAYYNSAALARISGTDAVFNHTVWFAGINHEFGAVAHTFEDIGTVAVSIIGLYTDLMPVRTPLQPDGTGETFSAGSYKMGVSYSRFLTDRVTIGTTVGYIYEKLYGPFNASAVSVDIATLYVSDFRGFRFGMQISNFGSDIKFVNEAYPIPTNFTFGLGINAIDEESQKLLVAFSAVKPNDGKPLGSVGSEWSYENLLFVRGGYQLYHEVATYSFGGGVHVELAGYDVHADYSFSKYRLLGGAHRFGVGLAL